MSDRRVGAWSLLALGSVAYACLMFVWFSLPAYLSRVAADLGLSSTRAGVLAGAVPLTYVPVALFSGLVVDRVGARRAIGAGLLVFGTAQALRAGAVGFPSMLAFTVLLGVGGTGITFGLPKLASELVPARAGRASSVYLLGSYAGTAAVFGVGRPTLGPALGGWRPLFRASGVAVVGFALVWLAAARAAPTGAGGESSAPVRALRAVLGSRSMRLLVVVGTVYLLVLHGLQGWLTALLESRGVAPGVAARVTTVLVAGQVAGVLAVPALARDRYRAAVVGCGLGIGAGVAGLVLADGAAAAAGPVAVAGLGVGGLSSLVRAIPVDLDDVGPARTGTAVGLVFAVGEVGGFVGPALLGALADATGTFDAGLLVLAAAGGVVVTAGAAMPEG